MGGRLKEDRTTAKNSSKNKHFNSVSYSPNGELIIGGGNSKYICIYHHQQRVLLKRIIVSNNRSLDGILYKLRSD